MQSVEKLVVPALENIGLRWEQGEIALLQVYMNGPDQEEGFSCGSATKAEP